MRYLVVGILSVLCGIMGLYFLTIHSCIDCAEKQLLEKELRQIKLGLTLYCVDHLECVNTKVLGMYTYEILNYSHPGEDCFCL